METVYNLYGLLKNYRKKTNQHTGTVCAKKITVKHTHFSLWGQSVLCMGFQKIKVEQTKISLL